MYLVFLCGFAGVRRASLSAGKSAGIAPPIYHSLVMWVNPVSSNACRYAPV